MSQICLAFHRTHELGRLFEKNKTVAISSAGDPALEAAMYLKELASKVYLIHGTDTSVGSGETINLLLL